MPQRPFSQFFRGGSPIRAWLAGACCLACCLAWCFRPGAAAAQDTTPPVITQATATLQLETNGRPLTVRVTAAANESSIFEVTCEYASSYPLYAAAPDAHWLYKTAAAGTHQVSSATFAPSISNLAVVVGPRVYHSDTLRVRVVAIDAAGNRSATVTAHEATIEMPLGPIPQPQGDRYGIAAIHIGGRAPTSGTVVDWAGADVIICSPQHLLGSADLPGTSLHQWAHQVRALPGSRNVAIIAFAGGTALWNNGEMPIEQRAYQLFDNIYRDAKAAASPDTNVLGHLLDGSLAVPIQSNVSVGSRLANLLHPVARDTLAWFLVNEWNHADNRVANAGLMFDVWEYYSDYAIVLQGGVQFSAAFLDRDRNGIPLQEDRAEQIAVRDARLAFLRDLRRRLHASAQDPAVGRHFLLGGNSVIARCDAEMAALLDHIFVEDLQCPIGCGTGLADRPYPNGLDPDYVRTGFPNYSLLHPDILPNPAGFRSNFANLAVAMRDSAGGPFITPESRGSCRQQPIQPSVFNEVYGLLFNHVYPIWLCADCSWDRSYNDPPREGYTDLHALGRATGPAARTLVHDGGQRWRRPYQFGEVEIVIADETGFDCNRGDRFEYRVLMQGAPVRQSTHWGPPLVESFFVTGWDSAGVGGTVRLHLVALASEPVIWERSSRSGGSSWSTPASTSERRGELAESWDTGRPPINGGFQVRVRARDEAGQRSAFTEVTVPVERFGGYGVEIRQTRVLGTAYGLPLPGGGYELRGLGSEVPDLAPPHYLEITGATLDGFVPQIVRWQNSLGGEGLGEVLSAAEGRWLIRAVDLHRGVNEIVITCVDQSGSQRLGALQFFWDHPGRPGARSR